MARGGKRPGAGRPSGSTEAGPPRLSRTIRLPATAWEKLDAMIPEHGKSRGRVVEWLLSQRED